MTLHSELQHLTRAYMGAEGLTQERMAERIGISQRALSDFLAGNRNMRDPGLSTLVGVLREAGLMHATLGTKRGQRLAAKLAPVETPKRRARKA